MLAKLTNDVGREFAGRRLDRRRTARAAIGWQFEDRFDPVNEGQKITLSVRLCLNHAHSLTVCGKRSCRTEPCSRSINPVANLPPGTLATVKTVPLHESPFLMACRGETPSRTPVWFMRQAGRSLPEYRALRAEHGFQEMITNPELAAEVTLQPVRRHGVDAAVFFSDIITPIQAIVPGITVETGKGPVIDQPFRSAGDVDRLEDLDAPTHIPYVIDAIQQVCAELDPLGIPVIGFAGAPFTLATYLIEGGKSKEFIHTKSMMHGSPEIFSALMNRLADISIATLTAQVKAGASAVQLFDSWAGILTEAEYREHVLPYSARIFSALEALNVPRVHFGVGTGELLTAMADAGPDIVGVDWRVSLSAARARVPAGIGLQGNLDPVITLAPWPVVERRVAETLAEGRSTGAKWIFNLGHGVLPETNPAVLTRIVEYVHSH